MTSTGNPWDVLSSTNRKPRTLETREHSARRKSWAPPSILPDPTPRDGKSFKWVRAETRGSADKVTYAKRLREGWEPVNAVDHPEIVGELKLGQSEHGLIETGGLILCWMANEHRPDRLSGTELHAGQRRAHEESRREEAPVRLRTLTALSLLASWGI
jgi:hypothetical protein